MFRFESGGEETPEVTIRILKSKNIYYLDQSIGWLYFVLWSVSFYPQVKWNLELLAPPSGWIVILENSSVFKVVMNFRRKSVVGFNFDYLGYDLAGFISFTLYNCLLFWSPAVFALYQQKNPGSANPIQFNDVFFCLHAIFIQVHINRKSFRLIYTWTMIHVYSSLRVVQTQVILFLKSISERVGSDIERLWILNDSLRWRSF